jgi:hypothetical protein
MTTLSSVPLALVIAVAAASQATAGMCDEPPYGADPARYRLFVDTLGEVGTLSTRDLFPNICRAKCLTEKELSDFSML